ncbi:MAG: 3-methyladenine DNA glycosylase [Bacteroidetes bacterium]|nr:3-methyladenine DNA glycosylase [Bacteroidota bacterium]NCQ10726.1 3-methyladenine DNA glycosylase [Bacteroidota bacterium]
MIDTSTLLYSEFKIKQLQHSFVVNQLLSEYLGKRETGEKHPIYDFLFEYYFFSPSQLEKFSPGIAVSIINDCENYEDFTLPNKNFYSFSDEKNAWIMQTQSLSQKRKDSLTWVITLLEHTQQNEPQFACLGLHEWAMLYKNETNVRHSLALRVSARELQHLVESKPLKCTHFDAFRFFTKEANPLNKTRLTKDSRVKSEQSACVHANMDIYKWSHKFYPWISSELILESFYLAIEARTIDMQASPYDVSLIGLNPIRIETKEGAEEYVRYQKQLCIKGNSIRLKLIHELEQLKNCS